MKKLFLCAAMAVLMAVSPVCAASYGSFTDVSGHWAAQYLQRAVGDGILQGSGSKLQPDGTLTGAQMTVVVTRDCGLGMWTKAYPGIASNTWYYHNAAAAYTVGLLPSDGSVSMTGNVTRAQVFEVLAMAYMELDPDASYDVNGNVITDSGTTGEAAGGADTDADSEDSGTAEEAAGGTDADAGDGGTAEENAGSTDTDADAGDGGTTEEAVGDSGAAASEDAQEDGAAAESTGSAAEDEGDADAASSAASASEQATGTPAAEEQAGKSDSGALAAFPDAAALTGRARAAAERLASAGVLTGDDKGQLNPSQNVTRAEFVTLIYRIKDSGKAHVITYDEKYSDISGIKIKISGNDVDAGGTLKAEATFSGIPSGYTFNAQWHLDGKPAAGYYSAGKAFTNSSKSTITWNPVYSLNMQTYKRAGFELVYSSGGRTAHFYSEKTINITNYPATSYYTSSGTAASVIFSSVRSSYNGNYKSSYNPDYLDSTKQNFVNSKGYSSKTQYLLWTNLATQKVNVFMGSKGNWQLVKVFRCGTGASDTPTPQGVTYVTYKQTQWKTDSYVCKPIVRFYPGTGYAFHSILYMPDGKTIRDASIGYPVSHGCVRMKPADIQWIYNNIPVNTTVVIY